MKQKQNHSRMDICWDGKNTNVWHLRYTHTRMAIATLVHAHEKHGPILFHRILPTYICARRTRTKRNNKRKENQIWNLCRFKRGYPFSQYWSNTNIITLTFNIYALVYSRLHRLQSMGTYYFMWNTDSAYLACVRPYSLHTVCIIIVIIKRKPCADFVIILKTV